MSIVKFIVTTYPTMQVKTTKLVTESRQNFKQDTSTPFIKKSHGTEKLKR